MTVKKVTTCDVTDESFQGDNPRQVRVLETVPAGGVGDYSHATGHISADYVNDAIEVGEVPLGNSVKVILAGSNDDIYETEFYRPIALEVGLEMSRDGKAYVFPYDHNDMVKAICDSAFGMVDDDKKTDLQ